MDDALFMHSLERMDEAGNEESCNFHAELSFAGNVVTEVATEQQVHDQIQIHVVLKRVVHIHNELTLDH